jgi:hypothetical protein
MRLSSTALAFAQQLHQIHGKTLLHCPSKRIFSIAINRGSASNHLIFVGSAVAHVAAESLLLLLLLQLLAQDLLQRAGVLVEATDAFGELLDRHRVLVVHEEEIRLAQLG